MLRFWQRRLVNRPRRPRAFPRVEALEGRQLLAGNISFVGFSLPGFAAGGTFKPLDPAVEGQSGVLTLNAEFFDSNVNVLPNQLTATVDYGDGTPLVTAKINELALGQFTVTDKHTFPEESGSVVPPFTFPVTLHIFENANPATNTDTETGQAQVLDAPLLPGNPIDVANLHPTEVKGGDTGNATSAAAAVAAFEGAIGGQDNGGTASPQATGFRTINWDGVKLDGTDFGGPPNTTVVDPGKTVAIPLNRFQERGVFFGAIYAVSTDQQPGGAFADVNPNAAGLFTSFSPHSVFAMFNDNGIDFKFVAPSPHGTGLVSAGSRGFGAVFQNVEVAGATTIEYFHDGISLGSFAVPVTGKGQSVFLGELFNSPIVTNVVLTLGTDVIFRFDGATFTSSGVQDDPANGHNLVTVDDWVYAEPVPIANGFPIVSGAPGTANAVAVAKATVGTPFTGVVATFSDQDPGAQATDYTVTINWGDGHLTNGTITKNAQGGFDVSGTNTYATAGRFAVNVDVADFGGGPGAAGSQPTLSVSNVMDVAPGTSTTKLAASPAAAAFGQPVTLTATVSSGAGTPTGTVTFVSKGKSLGTVALSGGKAVLTVTTLPPGADDVTAVYGGDANFQGSTSAAATVTVSPDVTAQVQVTRGRTKRRGRQTQVQLTLRNTSGTGIPAPLLLVLDSLTRGARVAGAAGVTQKQQPAGSPFVMVSLNGATLLAPGGAVTVTVTLTGARNPTFKARLLAGTTSV